MSRAAHFAAAILACYLAARLLERAAWSIRAPRAAIICWQWLGLALGLSAIGLPLALGLAPYDTGTGSALLRFAVDLSRADLPAGMTPVHLGLIGLGCLITAVLVGSTVRSLYRTLRIRRRHRDLLALVARDDPAAPGALVLDHPGAAAYCLPGVRPRVVVSAGALNLLDQAQLAAVLSHERAHADERHDLVLLPFTALCQALPRVAWVRSAAATVALLVEMRADDKARRLHSEGPLAAALLRFAAAGMPGTPAGALGIAGRGTCPATASGAAASGTPAGTLGAADRELETRVRRLLTSGRPPRVRPGLALAFTTGLVCLPIGLFLS